MFPTIAPIGSRKTCPNTMNRQQYVAEGGLRVDVFLSEKTGLTRSAVKKLIDEGHVLVSDRPVKAGAVLKDGEEIYIAGAEEKNGQLLTSGGRVLGAVAVGDDLRQAVTAAYDLADRIHFDNAFCRRDIGRRALEELGGEK